MAKRHNHECKTCGKSYYFCDNCGNVFNYLEVACSPECYAFYQDAVIAARENEKPTKIELEPIKQDEKSSKVKK